MTNQSLKTIAVSPETIALCRDFAERSVHSSLSHYEKRGQGNVTKVKDDITTGKVVEFAICQALRSHSINCSEPDIEVYEAKRKSYSADLMFGESLENAIHCKAQKASQGLAYGISWIFQKYDGLVCKPKPNDYIALASIADSLNVVELRHFVRADAVKSLYAPLKLLHLNKSKTCLYQSDLESATHLLTTLPWV